MPIISSDSEVHIKVYRKNSSIPIPRKSTDGAVCSDIVAYRIEKLFDRVIVHTGLHVAIPEGWEIQIYPRSNLTKYRYIIINTPGEIDSDYRGEILVVFTKLDNSNCDDFPYKEGERCAQMAVRKVINYNWEEVNNIDDLGKTKRGEGGYGSTGK